MPLIIEVQPEHVQAITGLEVTQEAISMAVSAIELFANRPSDLMVTRGSFHDQNLWLKAVAYQAAYLTEHPEALTTGDVASLSQGDISVGFRGSSSAYAIAPLAQRALRAMSFNKTRSISIQPPEGRKRPVVDDDLEPGYLPIYLDSHVIDGGEA